MGVLQAAGLQAENVVKKGGGRLLELRGRQGGGRGAGWAVVVRVRVVAVHQRSVRCVHCNKKNNFRQKTIQKITNIIGNCLN